LPGLLCLACSTYGSYDEVETGFLERQHKVKRIQGKIVSGGDLSGLLDTDDSQGITYSDLERMFSREDLKQYDMLCEGLVKLIGNKNNKEQWDMVSDPATGLELVSTLNRIEELRRKYNLPGTFHRIWRAKPLDDDRVEYDEVSW